MRKPIFRRRSGEGTPMILAIVLVLLMLFWFSIYCIHMGQDDPFLYFSF